MKDELKEGIAPIVARLSLHVTSLFNENADQGLNDVLSDDMPTFLNLVSKASIQMNLSNETVEELIAFLRSNKQKPCELQK